MIDGFLWIPVDMMGQVQKMMKYQGDEKPVLFQNLAFVVKPRLFKLALQFCRSPVLLVYIYIFIFLIYRRLASDILGFEDMFVERLCSFGVSGVYRSL